MQATPIDTTTATAMKARKSTHGDMPAAFITMISLSVESLLRTWATAISSAIGAITSTRSGMIRAVMPMNTRMVCPWLVTRSKSCSACVTQMTAVRLTSTTRNAPNVVRKIYRLIDPIRGTVPQSQSRDPAHGFPNRAPGAASVTQPPILFTLFGPQSGLAKAKPLNMHNEKLRRGLTLTALMGDRGARFWQANTARQAASEAEPAACEKPPIPGDLGFPGGLWRRIWGQTAGKTAQNGRISKYARCPDARFGAFCRPRAGCSGRVL